MFLCQVTIPTQVCLVNESDLLVQTVLRYTVGRQCEPFTSAELCRLGCKLLRYTPCKP